jgi:flagellar motility protein MotE (MotC chaperone)
MRLRLLPIVIIAAVLLLAETMWLVVAGHGGGVPAEAPQVVRDVDPTFRPVAAANDPAASGIDAHVAHDGIIVPPIDPITTGSIGAADPSAPAPAPSPPAATAGPPETEPAPGSPAAAASAPATKTGGLEDSPAERKLVADLHQRRGALDARDKALDLRETLLAAAQKRLDQHIAELKAMGVAADDSGAVGGAAAPSGGRAKRLDDLVTVYSGMKPKDAAKIFNHLDLGILAAIAGRMKPRVFSEILGLMDTQTAERLTLALAGHGVGPIPVGIDSLPKIEGHPTVP